MLANFQSGMLSGLQIAGMLVAGWQDGKMASF
jgi:hypothetical protein